MYHKEVQNQPTIEDIINKEELLERVDQDYELLEELHSVFVEDFSAQLSDLEAAISQRDWQALKAVAHRLKGALGNLSAKKAYDLAARIEMAACGGEINTIEALYPDLKNRVSLAIEALEYIIRENRF